MQLRFPHSLWRLLPVFGVVLMLHPLGWAAPITPVEDIIQLEQAPAKGIKLSKPTPILTETPLKGAISGSEDLNPEDAKNLAALWQTVVNRNPVIQFGLKQLATPPELRYAHASIMTRTISGLLSGAAMIPYAMGADQITAGATSIGANLADRAMVNSQKVDPSQLPSDTELVELSGVVNALQKTLVESYLQYKNSLSTIVQLRQQQDKLNQQYEQALASADPMDDLWMKQLSQTTDTRLFAARQDAKRYFLILERLVGTDGMRTLRFDGVTNPQDSGKLSESLSDFPMTLK